jgi:tetratricopeptide (TPR) repeat protein
VVESSAARVAGDARRAVEAAEVAVAIEDRHGASGRMFEALAALASSYNTAFRYTDADRAYRRVMTVLDAQGLGASLDAAMILNNWSAMLQNAGRYVEAVDLGARAVSTAQAVDAEQGASMSMLSTYANALATTGDHASAVNAFDESLGKARAAGSSRRLVSGLSLAILDAAEARDADRASRLLAEAERELTRDPSAYARGMVEASAARVALARGDRARAVTLSERAVATLERATPNQSSLRPTLVLLAQALNAAGRFGDGLLVAERSLQMARDRLADQTYSLGMGQALLEIAIAKRGAGDARASAESGAAALEHLRATAGPEAPWTRRAAAFAAQPEPAGGR